MTNVSEQRQYLGTWNRSDLTETTTNLVVEASLDRDTQSMFEVLPFEVSQTSLFCSLGGMYMYRRPWQPRSPSPPFTVKIWRYHPSTKQDETEMEISGLTIRLEAGS